MAAKTNAKPANDGLLNWPASRLDEHGKPLKKKPADHRPDWFFDVMGSDAEQWVDLPVPAQPDRRCVRDLVLAVSQMAGQQENYFAKTGEFTGVGDDLRVNVLRQLKTLLQKLCDTDPQNFPRRLWEAFASDDSRSRWSWEKVRDVLRDTADGLSDETELRQLVSQALIGSLKAITKAGPCPLPDRLQPAYDEVCCLTDDVEDKLNDLVAAERAAGDCDTQFEEAVQFIRRWRRSAVIGLASPDLLSNPLREWLPVLKTVERDSWIRRLGLLPLGRNRVVENDGRTDRPVVSATSGDGQAAVETQVNDERRVQKESTPVEAVKVALGWPDILKAIHQDSRHQDKISRLNKEKSGPIKTKRGAKPTVELAKLLVWWNEIMQDNDDRAEQESVDRVNRESLTGDSATWNYGKSGQIVDEIGGVKNRRSDRKTGR